MNQPELSEIDRVVRAQAAAWDTLRQDAAGRAGLGPTHPTAPRPYNWATDPDLALDETAGQECHVATNPHGITRRLRVVHT